MATQTLEAPAIELQDLDHRTTGQKFNQAEAPSKQPSVAEANAGRTASPPVEPPKLSTRQAWVVIIQLCGNNFISSFSSGMLMVCLPVMAADLNLPSNLLLWPTSVTYLASASCQLIAGSIADVLGPRRLNTPGSFLQSIFILATGLSQNGTQLIVFRTLLGIASSIFFPSARAILSTNIERGRLRNFAFAALILCFPLGAGLGLVLGGVYAEQASWRVGYYSSGAIGLVLSLIGIWTLPPDPRKHASFQEARKRLATEIDWLGAVMASGSLAILSYVLAELSASTDSIHKGSNIALLTLALTLIPSFALWMHHQEKHQKPALIPNSLWKSSGFTSVCLMIALSNAAQGCLTYFVSLFFQEIQVLTTTQTSLRLLPQAIVGALMCLLVGLLVNKITPYIAITSTMLLAAISPLLMAITNPAWPYWYSAFWAQVLGPLSIDVMFVIGALVIADAFSGNAQARGSAVFSTFSSLGNSIGLCIMSVISNGVRDEAREVDMQAVLKGYRASFWTQFAWILASCLIGVIGLRKLGPVGMKRD